MTPAERKVRAQSLRAEVDKKAFKGSWRAETIKQLLGKDDSEVSAESLAEAIGHKNTLDRNDHRKSDKIRWQLAWLGLIVCGLVLIAFGATISGMTQKFEHQGVSLLPYCIYLGLLGGFLSSAISVRGTDQKTRVPEIEVSFYAAIARGLLGAAASIPVFVIGKLGLINLGGAFDGQESKPWGLLLLCFISGFSERWFLTTIATVFRDDNRQPGSEEKQLRESAVAVGQGGASQQTERKCSCGDSKSEYFRAGIGALIVDRNGRILTFKRSGSDGHEWQLPQGGLLPGEAPCQALFREIEEETSIPPEKLQIIDEMKEWLGYELPVNCKTLKTQHGQVQKWFLLLYVDVDTDIRPDGSEFIEGRWMTPAELLRFAVPFRLPVYQRIIDRWSAHFADSAGQPRTSP